MADEKLRQGEGLPQEESSEESMQIHPQNIEKMLAAGQLARVKLYQSLLVRIKNGEPLKPAELRALNALEKDLECQSGTNDPPKVLKGYEEAAEYCGFSKRTLSHHVGRGNLKQNPDGSFEIEELDRFLSVKGRKRKRSAKGLLTIAEQKDLADLRWRLAKAKREELLVEQLNENLVPRAEIASEWAARVVEITAGLTALTNRLPPLLEGKDRVEMREIIREEIWNLRDQYAREGRYCPEMVP
jgi:hypothetical protein